MLIFLWFIPILGLLVLIFFSIESIVDIKVFYSIIVSLALFGCFYSFLFSFGIFGFILLCLKYKKKKDDGYLFLICFFLITIIGASFASRLIMVLGISLCFLNGFFIFDSVYNLWITKRRVKGIDKIKTRIRHRIRKV